MEPVPTLIFKGNTMHITADDDVNELLFTYTLSGTCTTFSCGYIKLKSSATRATSTEPFEYGASENRFALGNISYCLSNPGQ
jgi:hypothetical protein